jgi:hypothetical protein
MSSEVNDITANHALVSPDSARPVGNQTSGPSELAYRDGDDQPETKPASEQYDQWVLEQAERIEAAREPERDQRRIIALSLLVLVSIVAGLWWLQRTRRRDAAGGH